MRLSTLALLAALGLAAFVGCKSDSATPPIASGTIQAGHWSVTVSYRDFEQLTNGVTLVTAGVASDALGRQLLAAGARFNPTNATEWRFPGIYTDAQRQSLQAALLSGAILPPQH